MLPVELKMLNVILIDNHDLIRCGMKYILSGVENLQIIGESLNCEDAIANAQETKADIAIVSLNKFDVSMLDSVQKLMRRLKALKILVITDCLHEVILAYL